MTQARLVLRLSQLCANMYSLFAFATHPPGILWAGSRCFPSQLCQCAPCLGATGFGRVEVRPFLEGPSLCFRFLWKLGRAPASRTSHRRLTGRSAHARTAFARGAPCGRPHTQCEIDASGGTIGKRCLVYGSPALCVCYFVIETQVL